MLNIELQSVGLFMLIILFWMFVREKSLDLSSRHLYFLALLSSIVCISLDIMSIVCLSAADRGVLPVWITLIVCKLYIVSLCFQSYQGFLYAAGEFFAQGSHRRIRMFYAIWMIAGAVCIMVLPIEYYIEGRVVYTYGPSTTATYLFTIVYIVSTIVMAFVETDMVSRRRRLAILLWQGTWLTAALIQLFNPGFLLVGFATCFGMMILYAELENPHEGIDRMTGQFTANALMDYINDRYQQNKRFSSIHIRIEPLLQNSDLDTKKTIMLRATNFLNKTSDMYLFREADDEFVLIFKEKDDMEREYERAKAGLPDAIDMPVHIGYILMPDSSVVESSDEFFRFNHYFAEDTNTGETVIVDEERVAEIRELSVVKDMIRTALEEKRVEVFYQPFYDVKRKMFTAAEALVRIRDRDGSLIPPGVFIPIAEENGLIVPLGIEIFRQVCEFLATGVPQALGLDHIEVNISVAQFDRENPADFVERMMKEYNIDPSHINLEITETASPATKQILLRNMVKLISCGVNFSLDDFGTGRSNLDYFVEMPVDVIKFDFSFTQKYFTSKKARYVMESVIELMHRMKLSIVSEGVETKEQFEAMCALGVEYIQGFYFSKPIPKDEFVEFLQNNNKR